MTCLKSPCESELNPGLEAKCLSLLLGNSQQEEGFKGHLWPTSLWLLLLLGHLMGCFPALILRGPRRRGVGQWALSSPMSSAIGRPAGLH